MPRGSRRAERIGYGIGLHVGNVMFGNVGLTDRLTFSAFGSAVNEVQRLQSLTKKYPQQRCSPARTSPVIAAAQLATLGEEKLAGIRQKLTVLRPICPVPSHSMRRCARSHYDRISEAEQVMLLHRDAKRLSAGDRRKLQ